ncbi:hypothetical protein BC834DRAFT_992654 [Gloeopeniophorella convolvens]|nr:hypothetical protein BC834DRAFT_992654 [Gloeopeniophorella convolvens]
MSTNLVGNEEGKAAALTDLIISATTDNSPLNLDDIILSIHSNQLQANLDPLDLLPHLLPCCHDGTDLLLDLVAHHASAKEIVIAAQEAVERLSSGLPEDEQSPEQASLCVQFIRLISLLTLAIPRLVSRKPASQTLLASLPELERLVSSAAEGISVAEGRLLVRRAVLFVRALGTWVQEKAKNDLSELPKCYTVLTSFLDGALEACADRLHTAIAQRVFKTCFPRLASRLVVRDDWQGGEEVVLLALDALSGLGRTFDMLQSRPTLASLVLIAHAPPPNRHPLPLLVSVFPLILTSLQSNVALDPSLAILLEVLCTVSPSPPDLSPDIIVPLTTVLPPLCSAHPNPSTRHITFRILGRVLQLTPSILRLQILHDLISPTEDAFPHMRTAAIGLVKEATLEALSDGRNNIFASPLLLQTIGPYVFHIDPPELLTSLNSIDDLKDNQEPARLVECLGLCYVLLLRDVDNKTGIRDAGMVRSIQSSLLDPIRSAVSEWGKGSGECSYDLHAGLPLASLQIGVQRIDDALRSIGTQSHPS